MGPRARVAGPRTRAANMRIFASTRENAVGISSIRAQNQDSDEGCLRLRHFDLELNAETVSLRRGAWTARQPLDCGDGVCGVTAFGFAIIHPENRI